MFVFLEGVVVGRIEEGGGGGGETGSPSPQQNVRRRYGSLKRRRWKTVFHDVDGGARRTKSTGRSNSKHWFTTSFLQPLPYLVSP